MELCSEQKQGAASDDAQGGSDRGGAETAAAVAAVPALPKSFKALQGAEAYPEPSLAELADVASKYCKEAVGSAFRNAERQKIQDALHKQIGCGSKFLINVHPTVNAKSAAQKRLIEHMLAEIQEEFGVGSKWLRQVYDKARNRLTQSKAYKQAAKALDAAKKMEDDKLAQAMATHRPLRTDLVHTWAADVIASTATTRASTPSSLQSRSRSASRSSGAGSSDDDAFDESSQGSSATSSAMGDGFSFGSVGSRVYAPPAAAISVTGGTPIEAQSQLPKVNLAQYLQQLAAVQTNSHDEQQS